MSADNRATSHDLTLHHLSWTDFDDLARGGGGADVVRRLRRAERSRRLLLLRALVDEVTKDPALAGPLPSPDEAWELLARVQDTTPRTLDLMLAHPYTGAWVGYSTRLLRNQITGVCPLWMHIGHVHALAAAAAIRAGINFEARIPLWYGGAMLPTVGMARLAANSPCSVAGVRGDGARVEVATQSTRVRLPEDHSADAPGWWGSRRLTTRAGQHRLSVWLDDLDPYRGLYEPVPPERLDVAEVNAWSALLDDAWKLIVSFLPDVAQGLSTGLDSLVPSPAVPFGNWSASTGETFGSATVARPADAATLAATLVHEFHHMRLDGVLHLARLHVEDPRERFYTPWRNDPRPISGVLQGVYAHFGVTAFWRALCDTEAGSADRRSFFEFAHWRGGTWRTLLALRDDPSLTPIGQRFVEGVAERLGRWQDEPVPAEIADLAAAVASDHYAGWRIRYLRPSPETVATLASSWATGRSWPTGPLPAGDRSPTPVPDGSWSTARTELTRLALTDLGRTRLPDIWPTVPGATTADYAYTTGRLTDALCGYRTELATNPDRPASWVGFGLALSALNTNPPAAKGLLHHPELVRAVHRRICAMTAKEPAPEELATWIGKYTRSER